MTYLRDGFEHLDHDELVVYNRIKQLTAHGRTGNNSQIASGSFLSRTRVGQITAELAARGFIHNTGKGAAYHWRVTGQPVPYSTEARKRDRAEAARAREMNEKIRSRRTGAVPDKSIKCAECGTPITQYQRGDWQHVSRLAPATGHGARPDADCCDECSGSPRKGTPAWLHERVNDPYGTPGKHEFWTGPIGALAERHGDFKIFAHGGVAYAYDVKHNAWLHFASMDEALAHAARPATDPWS